MADENQWHIDSCENGIDPPPPIPSVICDVRPAQTIWLLTRRGAIHTNNRFVPFI